MNPITQSDKALKWLLVPFLLFTVSSCIPTYYMANSGMDAIVFTTPVYRDSAQVTSYMGGKFTHSVDSSFHRSNETNLFGQVYWFRTHTDKYYNFSYGAFGYYGEYHVSAVQEYRGKKGYFGGGLSSEYSWNIPLGFADFRVFGLKGTLYYEDGDYRKFKILAGEQKLAQVSTDLFGFNISETMELDIKLNKVSSIGLFISNGISGQLISGERFYTSSGILNFQTNKFMLYIQGSSTLLHGVSDLFGINEELSIGLNFRL